MTLPCALPPPILNMMGRPKGKTTKHLTVEERQRIRTLYFDGCLSQARIVEVTGYSKYQVRTAIRATSAQIPPRPGRPRKPKADETKDTDGSVVHAGNNKNRPAEEAERQPTADMGMEGQNGMRTDMVASAV